MSDPVTREGIVSEIDPDWLPGTYVDPALSPNGRQLAVTVIQDGVSDIWIKRLPQGRFSRFTLEGGHRATWTADGQALAFWSDRDGSLRVYQRRADGSAPTELVPALELTPSSGHQVVYSEDGEWMIVEADYDIYAVRLDSSEAPEGEPRGIKTTEDREFQPALSPDGRWLAYVSLAPGDRDFTVTVCAFPSCDATYSVSTVTGTTPAWTHDGRQLLYQGPGASLVAVDILPGTTFDWGEERTLFDVGGFLSQLASSLRSDSRRPEVRHDSGSGGQERSCRTHRSPKFFGGAGGAVSVSGAS